MKKTNIILATCLTLLSLVSMNPEMASSASATTSTTIKSTPELMINGYYVIYTNPIAPYINKENRLMVPLRAISDILGAEIKVDGKAQTIVVSRTEISVTLQVGKKQAFINEKSYLMDTVPTLQQGSYYIPLRALITAFDLKAAGSNGVVAITDDTALTTGKYTNFMDNDRFGIDRTKNNNALQPISFEATVTKDAQGMWSYDSRFIVKNISGQSISASEEDFHPIFIFEKASISDNDGPLMGSKDRLRYAVKKDDTFTFSQKVSQLEKLQVVLAAGRTLEPRT
ncbi:MAG: copper amine oxidase N-terminal domain-containing protein [Bacillota bacterium]